MWKRLWTYCCVDVNGREARIEDLDDAHVLVHEGEWDHRDTDQREGSREAGSNVEYFAITKQPSKYRVAAQFSGKYSVFDRLPKSLIKFTKYLG